MRAILGDGIARQAVQLTVLRFIGLSVGTIAQIYAARQLGPEKMGISGMALAAVAQGSILVTIGANTLLVREYKEAKTENERLSLISAAYTLRTGITLGLACLLFIMLFWIRPDARYLVAVACVLPLIFFESNHALWVLQAEERAPAQYLAYVASAIVSAVLIFAFVRPDMPAGSDMLANAVGLAIAFIISWYFAKGALPVCRANWKLLVGLLRGTKWLFLTALFTYVYTRFEQPMVGWLRSVDELGVYRSAWQVLGGLQPVFFMVPLLLYPKLIKWRQVSLHHLWERQCRVFVVLLPLCAMAAAISFVIVLSSFHYIYGPSYEEAALPCALLIVARFIAILNGVFAWGLWAAKLDNQMLAVIATTAVASLSLNALLIPRYGIVAAASVNIFSELLVLASCALLMFRVACRERKVY
jgi:O-antigen/teichoic acid export membrane protein